MLRRLFIMLMLMAVAALGRAQTLQGYEYWIDGDYAAHQSVSTTQPDISLQLPTEQMGQGVHFFNFRAQATDGEWGPLSRYLFFVPEGIGEGVTVTKMQCWIDNDHSTLQTVDVSGSDIAHSIDVSQFSVGVHYLGVRLQNSEGEWSAPTRHFFFVPDVMGISSVTKMEYWFDNDLASRQSVDVDGTSIVELLDVSQLSEGVHYLNLRLLNSEGTWSIPSRHFFFNPGADFAVNSPLVGYQYMFNDASTYVSIPEQLDYELKDLTLDLPDSLLNKSLEDGCQYTFTATEARLVRTTPMTFSIAFENKAHNWSNRVGEAFSLTDEVTHAYMPMPLRESVRLEKIADGDFHAMSIDLAKSQKYFFSSDKPCSMKLFKANGTLLTTIHSEELTQTYATTLDAGVYYAIVYDMIDDVMLTLMDNQVPTPVISYADRTVTISCGKAGATIRYTLDGTTPTSQSQDYSVPFSVDHNCTVKAIATYSGMNNSEIAIYQVDDFKVETPIVTFANLHAYISCGTEGAVLSYTLDGSDPLFNGQTYSEPIAIAANCTVKAIATREHYHNSDIATLEVDVTNLTTATPQITREGNILIVTSLTEGAIFHYTTDGSTPTAESPSTDRVIRPEHNCTVKVIAMKEGEIPSAVVSYTVEWMQVETPSFVFTDGQLSVVCNTPGATIYYEIGDAMPTRASAVYHEPLTLVDNRTVRALAVAANFNDSEIGEYRPDAFTCDKPVLAFDGRQLTMSCSTEGVTIRYTLDGSLPGNGAEEYVQPVDIDRLLTVKAIAMKANTNSSEVSVLDIAYYFDGTKAETSAEGLLSNAFQWSGTAGIEQLELAGQLNDVDMQWLCTHLTDMQYLDMSAARLAGNELTAQTFSGLQALTLSVPASVTKAAAGTFSNCPRLAAITWNPSFRLSKEILGELTNPNLLLYVKTRGYAPAEGVNVVVNNHADVITLSDAEGNGNFYCPQEFVADRISYAHHYAMQTGLGNNHCSGWETLVLPFDVQQVSHPLNGLAKPFAANRQNGEKPFWLCLLGTGGFESTSTIAANTPYIIAMPNNPSYADEYLLAGSISFEATNATVHVSDNLQTGMRGNMTLVPSFIARPKADGMLVLNTGEEFEGYVPGSAFFADLEREIRPFQAYVMEQGGAMARILFIGEEATGIAEIMAPQPERSTYFDLQGRKVGNSGTALGKGIYIIDGRKMLVK